MRFARVCTSDGVVSGRFKNGAVESAGRRYHVGEDATLLPPCEPTAIHCVGRNYAETIDQMGCERPEGPSFFMKPPAALCTPDSAISYPDFSDEVTYAGELAAVIDRRCRTVAPEDVPDVVRGYTVLNDVNALDQPSLTARKAFDDAAPLGPCVTTDIDPTATDMETRINDEVRQAANTESMLFDSYEIVSYISDRCTIEPGDEIEITYKGVGTLRNRVK